mmetsp:Transcript_2632/g.6803  ORF Transcript_2632/g.6803 Transcript_2632/m.6803 type:complete len:210 (-) Transcript_2632:197-826(-)
MDPREIREQAQRGVDEFGQQKEVRYRGEDQEQTQGRGAELHHDVMVPFHYKSGWHQGCEQRSNGDDRKGGQGLGTNLADGQRGDVQQARGGYSQRCHERGGQDCYASATHHACHGKRRHSSREACYNGHQGIRAHERNSDNALVQQLMLLQDVAYAQPCRRASDQREHLQVSPAVRERGHTESGSCRVRDLSVDQVTGQLILVYPVHGR